MPAIRNVLVTTAAMMAWSAVCAQQGLAPLEAYELRDAAEAAYRDRNAELAKELYLHLTEAFPDDPQAWFGLSRAYEWNGETGLAIAAGERVQALGFMSAARLSYRLARLHAEAGNDADAIRWIEQSLVERYSQRPRIQDDEAFAHLHDNVEFRRLAAIRPDSGITREAGMRLDVDYLVEEAQRMHAGLDRPAFGPVFLGAADELRRDIPALTDLDFFLRVMRLLAILDDGHTGIYGPDPDSPLQIPSGILPLKFYRFEEGVYITDGIGSAAEYAGYRVRRIGKFESEYILDRLSAYRGVDNGMTWNWMGPQFYLGQVSMLLAVGAAETPDRIVLTLEDEDGNVVEQAFSGGTESPPRKLRPSPAARGEVPLYLRDVDRNYWLHSFSSHNAAYFQFNQVRDSADQSIAEFAGELRERLLSEPVAALIIDVRHNNGGNNTLFGPLLATVVAFEQSSAKNRIYVITGRNTFSAAQNFINRLERMTDAVFVGEPSSSSPNFVGEETDLLLPWSRLRGSISSRYWQDSLPWDARAWIVPALPVPPTAADYFASRDAALEAVLALIGKRDETP